MLKKKDIVKEFELVVKQEIIEHNKAISASNLAVNTLSAKLVDSNNLIDSRLLKTQNRLYAIQREIDVCHSSFHSTYNDFKVLKDEQAILNERNHKKIDTIDQSIETIHSNQQKSDKLIYKHNHIIESMANSILDVIKECELESNRTVDRTSKAIKKLKDEILALPSEAKAVKDELMEELAINKIDKDSLLKEIMVLKKTSFINEKKIENLYMLIERLKSNK